MSRAQLEISTKREWAPTTTTSSSAFTSELLGTSAVLLRPTTGIIRVLQEFLYRLVEWKKEQIVHLTDKDAQLTALYA